MAIPTSGYPTTLDDTNATPSATVEFPQPASSTDLDATNVEHAMPCNLNNHLVPVSRPFLVVFLT